MTQAYDAIMVGGTAYDARTAGLISDVQTAVATGDPTLINVSLDALEQFYQQLWELHDRLGAAIDRTTELWDGSHVHHHVEHQIDGLHSAVMLARNSASSHHSGLNRSLIRMQRLVQRNLQAMYETYSAYVLTDAENAQQLDQLGETMASGAFSQV